MPVKTKQVPSKEKLASASYDLAYAAKNPWTSVETVKSGNSLVNNQEDYYDKVDLCRFFYKTEPVVSTVLNKLVEIGINDLIFKKKGLPENQFRIFNALKPRLLEFAEVLAQEFLVSGLVVPEISYGKLQKEELMEFGVKKYTSLVVPTSMFVRDPKTIKINVSLLGDTPSYYVQIPGEVAEFIRNKGTYSDGHEDKELYSLLKTYFPEFVKEVTGGATEIQVSPEMSRLSIRRKYTSDNQYPIPYVSPVLDALQHKREMRRMDYSIIDKIISAILHIKVGSDEFPVTQDESDQKMMNELRNSLTYRFNSQQNLERIFQLLTNHTVEMKWIFPESQILLDVDKYKDINQEVLFGLGFPQILITGESTRSGSSDPEIAMISPVKTMENFRRKIIRIIYDVCQHVSEENGFSTTPEVSFATLNLHAFATFMQALYQAYQISSVSRTSYAEALGYDFDTELAKLVEENDEIKASGLPEFGPTPNSRPPSNQSGGNNSQEDSEDTPDKEDTTDENSEKTPPKRGKTTNNSKNNVQ